MDWKWNAEEDERNPRRVPTLAKTAKATQNPLITYGRATHQFDFDSDGCFRCKRRDTRLYSTEVYLSVSLYR